MRRAARWIPLAVALTGAAMLAPARAAADDPAVSGPAAFRGVIVSTAGTKVGTEKTINLIPGTNVTITAVDNPGQKRVDITFSASGSGGGGAGDNLGNHIATMTLSVPYGLSGTTATYTGPGSYSTIQDANVTLSGPFGTSGNALRIYNTSAFFSGNFAGIAWTGPTSGGNPTEKIWNKLLAGPDKFRFGGTYQPFELDTTVADPLYSFGGPPGAGGGRTVNFCFDTTNPYSQGVSKCLEYDQPFGRFRFWGTVLFNDLATFNSGLTTNTAAITGISTGTVLYLDTNGSISTITVSGLTLTGNVLSVNQVAINAGTTGNYVANANTNASMTGGTAGSHAASLTFAVDPASGTLQGNTFNAANRLALLNVSGFVPAADIPAFTGDVTSAGGSYALTIAANAVTDAKFRQGVARSVVGVTGNATSNTADIQGTTNQVFRINGAGTALGFGAIDLSQAAAVTGQLIAGSFPTLTGDVTTAGGALATTIATNAVSNAKFRQGVARSVVGVTGNATANEADIQGTANQTLVINAGGTALGFGALDLSQSAAATGILQAASFPAQTGDVTNTAGSLANAIAANAVTSAKFRQSVALSVVGVGGNATANVADITGTASQVLRVNNGGTALGFGAIDLSQSAAATGVIQAGSFPALTGPVTTSAGSLVTAIANSGVAAATYGDASNVPQITIGLDGRVTSATNVAITGGGGVTRGQVVASVNGFDQP